MSPGPTPADILPLKRPSDRALRGWRHGVLAALSLYLFLAAINVMGAGLGMVGDSGDWLHRFLTHGENPFIALTGAVFITAVVQSSSFTTALIVTLVAAGDLGLGAAVFAIMGANIGTSVTGIIVSLGSMRIRRQFRRAFTAALMHDIFNLLTVSLLFPFEVITGLMHEKGHGLLTRLAILLSDGIGMKPIENPNSPIKVLTRPVVRFFSWIADAVASTPAAHGSVMAVAGLLLLFSALLFLVKNLRGALLHRIEALFRSWFFRTDAAAGIVGTVTTILVQSSSITTSLIVPLAGAGVVRLRRVYAFMLGANIGTTITGVIAATANPVSSAVTVALFHVTFNLVGTAIWYPGRRVPIGIAKWYGRLASKSKKYAFLFLLLVFVVIPLFGVLITELVI
ncbi:MAG: Na/Pi symporter [Phycisphaeraceae bacterium]|nr:Na/Pi symporter [Phycisphaeraceae bacterium]